MGTNYYLVKKQPTIQQPVHIGKSSWGWLFLFHEQDLPWRDDPIVWHTWPQVRQRLEQLTKTDPRYVILDEYDEPTGFDDFVEYIEDIQHDPRCRDNPDNFRYDKNVDGYRFTDSDFC